MRALPVVSGYSFLYTRCLQRTVRRVTRTIIETAISQ